MTYLRSAFNRADAKGKDLTSVLSEPEQYLAYSEKNTVLDEYKEIAKAAVREWHTEQSKPCDPGLSFAELKGRRGVAGKGHQRWTGMRGGGGMAESFSATGAYRTCPVCGKEWFILELQIWGYKRTIRWNSGNTEKLLYFCGWSCMRQFDADPKSYIEAEKNKAAAPKRLSPEATVRAKRRAIRAAAERREALPQIARTI